MYEGESMPAPLLVALGVWVATEIGKVLFDTFVKQSAEGAGYVGKVETAISTGYLRSITAEALDGLCENEPHVNVGMSPAGLVNIFERFMRAVAQSSVILPPEISEELFTELIQEGFSNAIQMSVGGALQSILNVWRGSYPPNPEDIEEIVEEIEELDLDLLTLLIAQAGANVPTTAWKMLRGFKKYVEKKHEALKAQAEAAFNKLNNLIALPYEVSESILSYELMESLNVIRECYVKAIQLIEEIGERAISRLQELKVELETVLRWIELSEETGQTLVDPDTAINVAIENSAEADAIYETFDEMSEMLLTKLNESLAVFNPTTILNSLNKVLMRLSTHYNNIISRSVIDVESEHNKLLNALKNLAVYRNSVDSSSSIRSSVNLGYVKPSGETILEEGLYLITITTDVVTLATESYDRVSTTLTEVVNLKVEDYDTLVVVLT